MKKITQLMLITVVGFIPFGFVNLQAGFWDVGGNIQTAFSGDKSGSCHDQPYIYLENNYKGARELRFNIVLADGSQRNMNVRKKDGAKFIMPQGVRTIRAYDGSTLIGTYTRVFPKEQCPNSNKYKAWKVTIKNDKSWDFRVV